MYKIFYYESNVLEIKFQNQCYLCKIPSIVELCIGDRATREVRNQSY